MTDNQTPGDGAVTPAADPEAAEIAALEAGLRQAEQQARANGLANADEEAEPRAPAEEGVDAQNAENEDGDDESARVRDDKGRFVKQVPLSELQQERKKRQELEHRLSQMLDMMSAQQAKPAAQEPEKAAPKTAMEEPDIDVQVDPFGAMDQMRRRNAELAAMLMKDREGRSAEQQADALERSVARDAVAFSQKTPDFKDAAKYLLDGVRAELVLNGVTDQREQNRMIRETEERIATVAIRQNRSPAQAFYDLAKARGWRGNGAAQQVNGQGAKPANASPAAQVAALRDRQEAATSLSGSGGSGREDLTVSRALAMGDADFADFADQHGGMRYIDRLLGKG